MPANTLAPGTELARLIDAPGEARSGHPCLSVENAVELRGALERFIAGGAP